MAFENTRRHIIDVDSLQRQLSVQELATFYGFILPEHFGTAGEQRMACPCNDCSGNTDERSVSINTSDPFKRWKCHREGYGCGGQGNFITLAYCMKHGKMPASGKPTGQEFYTIAQDLEKIAGGETRVAENNVQTVQAETKQNVRTTFKHEPNRPLAESENENARKLVQLDKQLTTNMKDFSSAASAYARRRPFLLDSALAQECSYGHMPGKSKSSLRGQYVFGIKSREGEPLAWVGRNVKYEQDHKTWTATGKSGREPAKYRFPNQSLFRRGHELYGQEFLGDEQFDPSLEQHGLILVEGFTDRIRLHELGIMSLAMMSNQLTEEQTNLLIQYAQQHANNRVGIMHDADTKGDEGAKETLWRMHEVGVDAYLVWSRKKHGGKFQGRQPESLTEREWGEIVSL